ncbi:hypothetical protein H0H87_004350 [Tephrocybe sp. NHM501043]|nr:hypothetical protein H0H87_004350 [Tephrocybe sp. NHM501043]
MPSSLYVPILLAGMILTDMQCVENCLDPDPANRVLYEQPVWQTLQMFLGEMLCFLPVLYTWLATRHQSSVHLPSDSEHDPHVDIKLGTSSQSLSGWKVLLLWVPAVCDLTGTTLMNVGLLYTPCHIPPSPPLALSVLHFPFPYFKPTQLFFILSRWVSLIIVMTGVALVGYSGSLVKDAIKEAVFPSLDLTASEEPEASQVLVGVFFILFAQVFSDDCEFETLMHIFLSTATQFVVEEKIMGPKRYSVTPLVAVGFEGFFGALSIIMLFPFLSIPSVSRLTPFFDLPRGWHQMVDNSAVLYSGIAIACSIAFFNYFGLSVTRHVSATARSLTDTCRTLSIWLISLGLGWEKFVFPTSFLQVAGFSLLVYGTFLFNNLISPPPCLPGPPPASSPVRITDEEEDESDALLSSSVLDETATLPADLGQSGFDVIPEGHHLIQPKPHSPPQAQT